MSLIIECVWEHNGNDTLLYATNLPGAYTRGESKEAALAKMRNEVASWLAWSGSHIPDNVEIAVVQDADCDLQICDADSDVLFVSEQKALTMEEYNILKALALKSAKDFLALYESIPDKSIGTSAVRRTFYGQLPRTADEMYTHTKNVNAYYFGEIDVAADNCGTIVDCRIHGFELLEKKNDFLRNSIINGSYGELWTLRKVLRRFLWHDRIHAKAMYRMAVKLFGNESIPDVFCFGEF